jgi:hypothetical protein
MSGPKVVRVRTRAEIAAECAHMVDELEELVNRYKDFVAEHRVVADEVLARLGKSVPDLKSKIESGEFDNVRRSCGREMAAVQGELESVEREVLERATKRAARTRKCQELAAMVASQLTRAGKQVPEDLERLLRRTGIGDSEERLENAEKTVSRALAGVQLQIAQEAATEKQRALAEQLADETKSAIDHAQRDSAGTQAIVGRIDRLISEIRTLDISPTGQELLKRALALASEAAIPGGDSRVDSLSLEWACHRKTQQERSAKRRSLSRLIKEVSEAGDHEALELVGRLKDAADSELDSALADAQRYCENAAHTRAAVERRQVVLEGLAALGYEVSTDLSAIWSQQGRIVVKKPERQGYGLEIAGPPNASQMQFKVVAMGIVEQERNPTRDHDAETLWCEDLTRLRELLSHRGSRLQVVHALGVGSVPLSSVSETTLERQERERSGRPQTHTVR